MADEKRCDGCNAKIIWIRNENGKRIPLDARKHPIYTQEQTGPNGEGEWVRDSAARITHFATCPNANQFSRSKK